MGPIIGFVGGIFVGALLIVLVCGHFLYKGGIVVGRSFLK